MAFGLGNTVFGLRCTKFGFWAAGFPGPITLLILGVFRLVEACVIKKRVGTFVDYSNSNFWREKRIEISVTDITRDDDNSDSHFKPGAELLDKK